MKNLLVMIFILYITPIINAQDYNHSLSPNIINEINRTLRENNLYKENMIAQDYNIAGMYFYNRKLWREAELMFSRAIYLDSNHDLAYYNLACVYSIQLSDTTRNVRGILGYNEILRDTIWTPTMFYYLDTSIRKDPNRAIRAREDSDFDNLRRHDPELFDAITLPVDQRQIYKYEGIFVYITAVQGDLTYYFADPSFESEEYYFNPSHWNSFDGRQQILQDLNLAYVSHEHYWKENEDMIGKRFIIEYIYVPRGSWAVGGCALFKYQNIISVREAE